MANNFDLNCFAVVTPQKLIQTQILGESNGRRVANEMVRGVEPFTQNFLAIPQDCLFVPGNNVTIVGLGYTFKKETCVAPRLLIFASWVNDYIPKDVRMTLGKERRGYKILAIALREQIEIGNCILKIEHHNFTLRTGSGILNQPLGSCVVQHIIRISRQVGCFIFEFQLLCDSDLTAVRRREILVKRGRHV
jgi:hypothetical protein